MSFNIDVDIAITADLPIPYTKIHILRRLSGFHLAPHMHTFSHLITVTSGELYVIFNGKSYQMHTGQAILLPSHIQHELYSDKGYSEIGIDLIDLTELSPKQDLRDIRNALARACPTGFAFGMLLFLPASFEDMYELVHSLDSFNRLKLLNRADSFVVSFIESTRAQEKGNHYRQFINLLSSPKNYNLSLSEICEKLDVSKTHLERLVNERNGCGVAEYCKRLKMTRACALLLDTELSISDIAEYLCFNSASHFSFFFKNRRGITPSEYRNSSRSFLSMPSSLTTVSMPSDSR